MANKTIPQLPEQTGKTNDDLLVIVDSGETTTSKIKVSTLLDGVGAAGVTGDTLNDAISSVNSIIGTPNVFSGTTNYVNFGFGNEVYNNTTTFGYNNYSSRGYGSDYVYVGYNNNVRSQYGTTGGEKCVVVGRNNTIKNDGMAIGTNLTDTRGIIVGYGSSNSNNNDTSSIIVGKSSNSTASRVMLMGENCSIQAQSIGIGYFLTAASNNITMGWGNNTSNGDLNNGYNLTIGANNVISGGIGNSVIASNSDITSTGNYNTILNGNNSFITGTTSGTTILSLSNHTATKSDVVYLPAVNMVNYASYNFADDTAAAAGGVELGEYYHNNGALRVRIV